MKLIVGLGNPGPQYADSRHNVGFLVLDELARGWKIDLSRFEARFEGLVGEANAGPRRTLLLKPSTFMNLSGRSVGAAARFYKIAPVDVLTIYDDLDLGLGQLRLRASGSAGGHNGMTDVLRHLSTQQTPRIRIGIDKVHRADTVGHVLGRFAPHEREAIDHAVQLAADAAECWQRDGIEAAMNRFNRRAGAEGRRRDGSKGDEA